MEWISVKDELPENEASVLVYIADRGTVMLTHYFGDFALTRVGVETGFTNHGVTHWIAIEPPCDS